MIAPRPAAPSPEPAVAPLPAAPPRPFRAWLAGLGLALRYWPAWLLLWLGSLLAAGLLALLPVLSLYELAGLPAIRQVADGVQAWQVLDLIALSTGAGALDPGGGALQTGLASLIAGFLLVPLLGWVVSAFLYGGALLTYREAPAPFTLRRFLWGGWRWFGPFLLLGFLQALLFVFLPLPLLAAVLWAGSLLGDAGLWLTAPLALFLFVLWLVLFETGRAQAVAAGDRNPFRGLGRAIRLLFRRPLALLGFYLLSLLLLLALHTLFRFGLFSLVPLGAFPLAFLAQQGFILLRLFLRAARLGGLMEMARS